MRRKRSPGRNASPLPARIWSPSCREPQQDVPASRTGARGAPEAVPATAWEKRHEAPGSPGMTVMGVGHRGNSDGEHKGYSDGGHRVLWEGIRTPARLPPVCPNLWGLLDTAGPGHKFHQSFQTWVTHTQASPALPDSSISHASLFIFKFSFCWLAFNLMFLVIEQSRSKHGSELG